MKIDAKLKDVKEKQGNVMTLKTGEKSVKPKLPKLIPRRFDGDPKMWLEFWDSFEGSIHNNKGLSDRDKFDHLKGLLDGPATLAVTGFTLTSANYEAAINPITYGGRGSFWPRSSDY